MADEDVIPKLVGYLNVARQTDPRFQGAVNVLCEAIMAKLAVPEARWLPIAQAAAQEALKKSPAEVTRFCAETFPIFLSYKDSVGGPTLKMFWDALVAVKFQTTADPDTGVRAKCPKCRVAGATIAELKVEAKGLRPAALMCHGCSARIDYGEYLRFNNVLE